MAKRAKGLSAAKLSDKKPGRYHDGDGLCLLVRRGRKQADGEQEPDSAWWLLRYTSPVTRKVREMGLGRARGRNAVSLADARKKASNCRAIIRDGSDPLAEREADATRKAQEAATALAAAKTFKDAAEGYVDAHRDTWRNAKHAAQWSATLKAYIYPVMGALPVSGVGVEHVTAALDPIWRTKPETASRVRGRIEAILDYARARNWRGGENPARWRGHLENILPPRSKVARVEHHAALPYSEIGDFIVTLRAQDGLAASALELAILTAARTGEIIGARWNEIDLAAKLWTVPATRIKGGREHRVPLTDRAIVILTELAKLRPSDDKGGTSFVLPGRKFKRPLSNMAMLELLRRMGRDDVTVHGFRAAFRTWAAEATNFPREVAEAALAHAVGDAVEQAYQHSDFFPKRRKLMEAWASYCATVPRKKAEGANVVQLARASA